ncbi:MAG: FMN-binding protein [Nitrospiraceae bacterium]|nr:MAG: FMN-binding protein [Nitrospiraceae bacterium]
MTGKDIVKVTLNLVIVYLIGGFILAFVYANASPRVFRNNEEAEKKALKELVPDADANEKHDWTIHDKHAKYFIMKKGGDTIGYVIQSFGKGYSSYINTFIATDKDFVVQKINILGHGETPGLGDEIELDYFKDRLKGKDIDHLKVLKTETTEYVEAISGATISSRAVTEDAVKNGVAFLIKTVKEGGNADVNQQQH